jgi:DMSO/TMAO reductase YedYZ molybdopterin-dependent catalytic subunit
MKAKKLAISLAIIAAVTSGGLMGLAGCQSEPSEPEPTDLGEVEITEWEGEDLSSINDFRENSIKGPQEVDIESYRLKISGLVDEPYELTYDEALSNYPAYHKVMTISCVEGWDVKLLWEGIRVSDLINQAGVQPEAQIIIFHAVDDYTTSLPIDYIVDNDLLLAYKMNEVTLPAARGFPFELAAESKWGYKWIKWVDEIELSSDTEYRGFWESRGYSNTADLDDFYR